MKVIGYCDARFQTDRDDSKSQTEYLFTLNDGAIIWKSSKQSTTADSTAETEYIAASEAAKEVVWIKKFIMELEVLPAIKNGIMIYYDNTGAITQSKEPMSHQKIQACTHAISSH